MFYKKFCFRSCGLPIAQYQLLLIMRLTLMLLFTACLLVSAKVNAQQVTLTGQNLPLERVIKEIKRQTNFFFLYQSRLLAFAKPVSVDLKGVPIKQALDICFANQPFAFKIFNNTVIIRQKESITTSLDGSMTPEITKPQIDVTGKVLNEAGESVEGVTVTIVGAGQGTYTNAEGEFTLESVEKDAVLNFTAVNMETYDFKVNGQSELVIRLKTKISSLQDVEVVVSTGYQDIPKERITGSFVTIDNKLLNRKVSSNILERIYEVVSGLYYDPKNAGKNPLPIRGISSINANSNPLIVVDGFPYEDGSPYISGNIGNVNPNDIETISVLKDAAAASIWGARAGNGVIVITTKRGKFNQKTSLRVNSNITIGEIPDLFRSRTISVYDEIEFEKQRFETGYYNIYDDYGAANKTFPAFPPVVEILLAKRKGIITQEQADLKIKDLMAHDIRSDFMKYMLQKSIHQQNAINISGGTSTYNYFISVGYDKTRSYIAGNEDNRFTIRFDNTIKPIKNLEVGGYITYTQTSFKINGIDYTTFINTNILPPYLKLADEQGNALPVARTYRLPFVDTARFPGYLDWRYRPVDEVKNNSNEGLQYTVRFGGYAKYYLVPGLHVELKGQYEKGVTTRTNLYNLNSYYTRNLVNLYMYSDVSGQIRYPVPRGAILDNNTGNLTAWNFRSQLNFNKRIALHTITALAGWEVREINRDDNGNRKYGYDEETHVFDKLVDYQTLFELNPRRNIKFTVPNGDSYLGVIYRFLSYYGNFAYTYRNKFTLTLSGRKDGANLFGIKSNQKITPLWSSGFAWNLSNETFYKINWLPELRIRATYGFNGNVKNDATAYATLKYSQPLPLTGVGYAEISSPPNPQLRWEKVKIINIGVDFAFKGNKISGTAEYYWKNGIDLIGPVTVDPTSGVFSYVGNNASTKTNGFDFTLNLRNIDKKFKWYSTILLSCNFDKVYSYHYQSPLLATDLFNSGTPYIGRPLYSIFSYRWGGLDPATGDPRGYIADKISDYSAALSGNNIKPGDLVYNGPATPRLFGSVLNAVSWKNITLSVNILYRFAYFFRRNSINYSSLYTNYNGHSDYSLRWQKPGDESITDIPSLPSSISESRDAFFENSEVLVERADHIRVQDIRLSYNFLESKTKKRAFKRAQLYIYGNNIGIIWRANKLKLDPALSNSEIPIPKTISIGVSFDL